ncbi:MAG: hypothetical protein QM831_31990 [Kofleriaceae bacterium]
MQTIAVVSFVTLVLELTSTRLFAYIGSSHATATALSIALLGLGIGAALRIRHAAVLVIAICVLAIAASFGAPVVVLVPIAVLPFTSAGGLLATAYAARGSDRARATYAIDLISAAAGCVLAPYAIGPLSPIQIMFALALIAVTLLRGRLLALAVIPVALLLVPLPDGPLDVLLASDPNSEKAIVESSTSRADILDSAWSPIGRLDVHRTPNDPSRLGVFTDGMSPTYMVVPGAPFEDTWGLLMSLPYRALHPDRVLVLASGAGASVWLARRYGAHAIDAVEVNPAIPDLLARWRVFAGDVYERPGTRLITADARRFLADSNDHYDLIELALALTGNAHAEQPSGLEANLYTVEAVELYLRHLSPTGELVLIHSDPGNAYRQLLTVLDALKHLGVARPLEGIVVIHDARPLTAYHFTIIVRMQPIPIELVDALDVEPAELLWAPGDPPERATALLDPRQLGITARDDLSPVHDERPYFFQNTRGLVATALAEPGRLWVLAGALALIAVIMIHRRVAGPAIVATFLGSGYLCVELALIQRFTLAAGGTLYALSFVLFCLLAWSATGALLLAKWWRRHDVACFVAALAIAAATLIHVDSKPLIALLLAPTGLAIGAPFPTLLAREPDRIATLWAINGAAAVAGGVIGVLALRVGGSTDTLLLAAGLYVMAALVPTRSRLVVPSS